jgi:hypothetical protein
MCLGYIPVEPEPLAVSGKQARHTLQNKHYKKMQARSTPFTGWFHTWTEGRLRDCGASGQHKNRAPAAGRFFCDAMQWVQFFNF